ncbi:MAG: GNVR domain-containing protein [Sulfuricella sp.]|nr:GNVR domain-containing protein [Sulfuricella sp.]
MHELITQFLSYLKAAWQHRWHAIVAAWVIAVSGWIVVALMPDRYEASARVYVDTQSILKPLLSGLAVQPNLDQKIVMMSRTLLSRPNVERVVRMADLDINVKTAEDKENLINSMISKIEIKNTGQDNLYTLAYRDRKPEVAKRVVQSLLTIFVEGSLGDKRKDADSAKHFIDDQIKAYEQKLISAENALKDFKRQHMDTMPGEGRDYFAKMSETMESLSQARLALREAENGRDAIRKQLAGDDLVMLDDKDMGANPEIDARIQALRKNLDSLQLNYTDRHPDIVAAKRIIEQLEEQKKQEAKTRKASPTTQNPVAQQLKVALADAEAGAASMRARVAEYESRYNRLRAAADAIPQVEADFTQLNRDYEVNKTNYEKLLATRDSAQMSGDMDANSGIMNFRIIDPPRVPLVPSAPNRPLLMSLVLLGSLAGGVVVAFLVSQFRPTFNDRWTLRNATGVPLLGAVSLIWTDAQKKRQRSNLIATAMSTLGLFGSYGVVMVILFFTAATSA